MNTFAIGPEDAIMATPSGQTAPEGAAEFSTEAEFARLAQGWPAGRLVALWNGLSGVTPVRRFTDRTTAVRRIWRALAQGAANGPEKPEKAQSGQRKGTKRQTAAAGKRAAGGTSKGAEVLRLLRQPGGATLSALISATGWQAHSVRGFISRTAKLERLKVRSVRTEAGRVYSIKH